MKKTFGYSLAAVAVLAMASAVQADNATQTSAGVNAGGHEHKPPMVRFDRDGFFDRVDANKDGKISREEFMAFKSMIAEKEFERLDVNKTGFFTKEDTDRIKAERAAKRAEKMKMNGDGPPSMPSPGPQGQK